MGYRAVRGTRMATGIDGPDDRTARSRGHIAAATYAFGAALLEIGGAVHRVEVAGHVAMVERGDRGLDQTRSNLVPIVFRSTLLA